MGNKRIPVLVAEAQELLLGHALDSAHAIGVGYNELVTARHPQVEQPHVAC
jgi:hypothetical protein